MYWIEKYVSIDEWDEDSGYVWELVLVTNYPDVAKRYEGKENYRVIYKEGTT